MPITMTEEGTITLSCGHQAKPEDGQWGLGIPVALAAYDRKGERCVNYMTVCTKCRDMYEKIGIVLKNEYEANAWLENSKHENNEQGNTNNEDKVSES